MQQLLRSIQYTLQHAAAVTAGISCTYIQQYERHTWYEVNPIITSMHDARCIIYLEGDNVSSANEYFWEGPSGNVGGKT